MEKIEEEEEKFDLLNELDDEDMDEGNDESARLRNEAKRV